MMDMTKRTKTIAMLATYRRSSRLHPSIPSHSNILVATTSHLHPPMTSLGLRRTRHRRVRMGTQSTIQQTMRQVLTTNHTLKATAPMIVKPIWVHHTLAEKRLQVIRDTAMRHQRLRTRMREDEAASLMM